MANRKWIDKEWPDRSSYGNTNGQRRRLIVVEVSGLLLEVKFTIHKDGGCNWTLSHWSQAKDGWKTLFWDVGEEEMPRDMDEFFGRLSLLATRLIDGQ